MTSALVAYYSVYGNTEKAGKAIAEGLRDGGVTVETLPLKKAKPSALVSPDLLIIGSPTHSNGIPDDVRHFLEALRQVDLKGKRGAAFDTRYEDAPVGALTILEEYLHSYGITLVRPGLPVLLPSWAAEGPLKPGELSKCREFGRALARTT